MESAASTNAHGTEPPSSLRSIPIDSLLLACVPPASIPSDPAPTTTTTGSLVSPTAVAPPVLQSTLGYQQISSPAPAYGFPVVSAEQEQSILNTLSLPSVLQLDITISPFAYLAAMPTAAEVVQICDVQRRAVMRMWRSFHWKWNNEMDVKKFVSKELSKRFRQSKRSYEKKMTKLATSRVANADAERTATTLPDSHSALAVTTNLHPNASFDAAVFPTAGAALPYHSASSQISASEPTTTTSSGSSGCFPATASPVPAWSDPDVHLARAFLGDAYWNTVDYAIADDESRAFSDWGTVPAVGVPLQDWMFNTGFLDAKDV
ncbi:hypothetical protein FPQ18DRAFT_420513 [Pyronema domesticum]|nr:hypothetical protein FPQ18DRAFT_420513 [Pyronema domesticum]